MPNFGERNENDLKTSSEKIEWLSEVSGVAMAEINSNGAVQLNDAAKNLLKAQNSHLGHDEFINLFNIPKDLRKFISGLENKTSHFHAEIKRNNIDSSIELVGRRFTETESSQIIFKEKSKDPESSTKKILNELERHESQLEVAVKDRAFEIHRLNNELENYKAEIKRLVFSHSSKMKESEAQLNSLSNNLPHGAIFRFKYQYSTQNISIVYAGNFIAQLLNSDSLEEIDFKQEFLKMIHPDDRLNYIQAYKKFNDKDAEINLEFRIIDKTGETCWLYMRAKPNSGTSDILFWDGFLFDITEKKLAEEKILFQQHFESLIVDISTRFINIKYDDVDKNINQALKEICLFSETESAYIYFFDENSKEISLAHYFKSENLNIDNNSIETFQIDNTSKHLKDLLDKGIVQVHSLNELDTKGFIYKECKRNGIHSFVNTALFYQNKFLGLFGVASCNKERYWSEDEMSLLQVIGDIFVGAVKRKQAVQKLLESEKTYREIYNASSEAIFIFNIETGKILDVNQATLEMFQDSYENVLQTNVNDLVADNGLLDKRTFIEIIQLAVEAPQDLEIRLAKPGGEKFWAEITLKKAMIYGAERVIGIFRDISVRKDSEQLLKENEEKYRMIVEGQNDLIVKVDTNRKLLFVSLSYCKMFGKTEEELFGEEFVPMVHEEDKVSTQLAMEKLFKPPYSCYLEQRAKTKDGWRWLAWSNNAILNEQGEVSEIVGVGRDITYQKMVENALRESEERFRSIVQNLSDVVFLLDENANIKYVTPSSVEYLGLAVEEMLGYNLKELIHPDDRWLAEENIQLHINGSDYTIPYEVRMKYSNTSYRVFEVKSQSMLNHPSVRSIIFTVSDITDRKIMEKQILDAIIKTEEKERERFAKDLHDDLGPLLSSIKMYIGMFDKAKDEKKQQFIVQNLQDIVKEAIATTKDVSNDLNPHVLNNYGLVSALELFIDKVSSNIEIKFHQEIDSTRYTPAIELSVYRVSKELLNNSIKHSGANQISIELFEKNDSLYLKFEDNGKGLEEKALAAKKPGGMGLSNIISRAKSLNANFNFHTNLENGFKFDLVVPLIQE